MIYPVTFTVQNNLPYAAPQNGYPGSGSHTNHAPGVYTNINAGYASIVLHGKPNTKYLYKMTSLPGSYDGGLVYGTIQNWTRAYEDNRGIGAICKTGDPVGTQCYIRYGFEAENYITTDENGEFSWLFLHCSYASHHFFGQFDIYYSNGQLIGTTRFETTK